MESDIGINCNLWYEWNVVVFVEGKIGSIDFSIFIEL
jgi:hypothetical protein